MAEELEAFTALRFEHFRLRVAGDLAHGILVGDHLAVLTLRHQVIELTDLDRHRGLRVHEVDRALNLAALKPAAGFCLRIVGAMQLLDRTIRILDDFLTGCPERV